MLPGMAHWGWTQMDDGHVLPDVAAYSGGKEAALVGEGLLAWEFVQRREYHFLCQEQEVNAHVS